MNHRITAMFASAAALAFSAGAALADEQTPAPSAPAPAATAPAATAPAAAPAPPAPPSLMPSMTAPLAQNPSPTAFDLGPLGNKVYITGALSGMGFTQNHHVAGDQSTIGDLTNAQIFVNKVDGEFQYFVEVGAYSFPTLGAAYTKATTTTSNTYDVLPQAFIKYQPTAAFSIQAGKLPTLIGDEYAFTVENSNIERGLLWGQEPLISKGVQANYTTGPVTFNLALTDGFYSNDYSSLSGAATWTISPTDSLIAQGEGATHKTKVNTAASLSPFNNESVYALIWSHTVGPWNFTPYIQYTDVPRFPAVGVGKDTSTFGGALLATYTFDAKSMLSGVSLPARVEYLSQSNGKGSANLLYGPGSNAWSFTVTPTYTFNRYFIRGELSYVNASSAAFGTGAGAKDQTRGLVEVGVLF